MLDRDWLIKVELIYREGNQTTNLLASLEHSLSIGAHSISIYDLSLSHHIMYDLLGISKIHLIIMKVRHGYT
ncbi:hypothetical protein LINPERPRIM_LOCUS13325 [Linum perenne]